MNNDLPLITALSLVAAGFFLNFGMEKPLPASPDVWVAIFTFMLFISTTGLGLSTYGVWRATRQSIVESKENSERQLRAYVCLVRASLTGFSIGEIPSCVVVLENSGQTPAYKLHGARNMDIREIPLDSQLPAFADSQSWPRRVLGPRSSHEPSVDLRRALTSRDMNDIRQGTHAIYVWGVTAYTDAFGQAHETTYCLFHTGEDMSGTIGMSAFHEGNVAT